MRSAPSRISAVSIVCCTSFVMQSLLPIPIPARQISRLPCCEILQSQSCPSFPQIPANEYESVPGIFPAASDVFCADSITYTGIPSIFAASSFSWQPPARPLFFVTIWRMSYCLRMAAFISVEKGPCNARICRPLIPCSMHCSRLSLPGRIRTCRRSFNLPEAQYTASSLLPVVSRILPSVFSKAFAQSALFSKYWTFVTMPSASVIPSIFRSRRR